MMRTGIGVDVHKLVPGRSLVLGGVRIAHPKGLEGHSDADVVCHAVADALLGAVADGDIGTHFPNTDPAWKDANSLELLRVVRGRVEALRGRVSNVDVMVVAEEPRIAPYRDAMRQNLAGALGVDVSRVSVKATTAEGLGPLGRAEGIAALAVGTVEQSEGSGQGR